MDESNNRPQVKFARRWEQLRASRAAKQLGAILGAVALIVGLWVDIPALLGRFAKNQQPVVEMMYFSRQESGTLVLQDFSDIHAVIDLEDIKESRLRLPLNLAFRNLEKDELQNTRVVLSYPLDLEVEPQGSPLIDPNARTLTYEHNLRDLAPIGEFTPMDTIDVLQIKFTYAVMPTVVLTKDGVPIYLLTIAGFNGSFEDTLLTIGMRVEAPGRPPSSASMHMRLKAGVQILGLDGGDETHEAVVSAADVAWFQSVPATAQTVDEWEGILTATDVPHRIRYQKLTDRGAVYQRISVDGVSRRLLIDRNDDQRLDVEVVDTTGDGVPDFRRDGAHTLMPDWPAEAVG